MASDNKTVAEIAKRVRRECNSYPLPTAAAEMLKLVRELEAAHRREVDSLNFKLMTAKSEQKTAANVIIEQTNKVEKLEREVADLRECLRIIRDNLLAHTIKSEDGKYVNNGAFLSEEFVDDERWRKALEGAKDARE